MDKEQHQKKVKAEEKVIETAEVEKPAKKEKTLKERISEVIKKNNLNTDTTQLEKDIFELVQRSLYPNQFCPNCDDRLFIGSNGYECPNCGFKSQVAGIARPAGKVDPRVEAVIQEAENAERQSKPTTRGEKIKKLASQIDNPSGPSKDDEVAVRGDPNVGRGINWV